MRKQTTLAPNNDAAALDQSKHYYASAPELLKQYAEMIPLEDGKK